MENGMLVLMATAVPTQKLISDMQNALEEWQIYKDEDHEQRFVFHLHLLIIHFITKGDMKKAISMIKDINNMSSISANLFQNHN